MSGQWLVVRVLSTVVLLDSCGKVHTTSENSPENIQWSGHTLHEVRTLRELPAGLQSVLGVGIPGLDGIADRGGKYNRTDAIVFNFPRRRFLVAGLDGDAALVAIEHGGIALVVEVTLFSNTNEQATVQRKWSFDEAPQTLRTLVDRLPLAHAEP